MMKRINGLHRERGESGLPETSLLICSRNRPRLLFETIQSILAGDEIPTEIVIIDQSDTLDPQLVDFQPHLACEIRYFWTGEKGVSLGRNKAVEVAKYSLLVLTDDDMLITPTWFGSIVRALIAMGPHNVVTGRVLSSDEDNVVGYAPSTIEDEQVNIYEGRVNCDVLFTGNMAIYRSDFESVGGFDTRLGPGTCFPAAEDNDLGFRLLEGGCRIHYEPRAIVYHRAWRSENEFFWLHWDYGRGQGAFYAKYFSLKDTYMIKRMAWDVVRSLYRLLRPQSNVYQDAIFVAGMLYGAAQWLTRPCSRKT
jgi:GT2 family glycosyltransferase